MPRMFQVRGQTPGLNPQLQVKGVNAPLGTANAPLRVRTRVGGLAGGANFPGPNGEPGNGVWPYNESALWGLDGGGSAGSVITPVNDPNLPASSPGTHPAWTNPDTFAQVGINAQTSTSVPVLTGNSQRRALIIQNNSIATFPDTTPVMYVGFNAVAQVGVSLGLSAGLGILFDTRCPRDSIYITFGAFSNGGGTTVVQGAVVQAIYSP